MKAIFLLVLPAAASVAVLVDSVPAPREASGPSPVVASPDTTFPPATIALGDKIFHGKAAGGLCFSCHGMDAKGMKGLGPNLTDATWLHGDGSYQFIVSTIEAGVMKPKESAAPMPPKGGGSLNAEQVRAVAAYVYSLRPKP